MMATSVADLVDVFLSEMERTATLRPGTLANYRSELQAAAMQLTAPLEQLGAPELDRFLTRSTVAPGTIVRRQATLRRFFAWAVGAGWCTSNPLAGSLLRRPPVQVPRPIPDGECAALDRALAARRDSLPLPYALLFAILRETGMRPHEALALRRSDVSMTPGVEVVRVWTAHRTGVRCIPLTADAAPRTLCLLGRHIPGGGLQLSATPLAESPRGGRVSYDALNYQWGKLCAVAGLLTATGQPRYTLQQLRDTRGCELVAQGMPLARVQQLFGHRDRRSTLGYGVRMTDPTPPVATMLAVADTRAARRPARAHAAVPASLAR